MLDTEPRIDRLLMTESIHADMATRAAHALQGLTPSTCCDMRSSCFAMSLSPISAIEC